MRIVVLLPLLALLFAPSVTAQEELWVLVNCDAQMRASILETSSIVDADPELCEHNTNGQRAWQGLLRSCHGDLVKVSTVPSPVMLGNACAGGPFDTLPGALDLFVPATALVGTVPEPLVAKTRDKRRASLRPGAALHAGKGPWYTTTDGTETAEVKLTRKQVVTEFSTPPKGACVAFDVAGTPDQRFSAILGTIAPSPWAAPAGTIIYLPTMEQIGETAVDWVIPGETFEKGMLTCLSHSPLRFAQQGPAPLCFLTLALNPAEY